MFEKSKNSPIDIDFTGEGDGGMAGIGVGEYTVVTNGAEVTGTLTGVPTVE